MARLRKGDFVRMDERRGELAVVVQVGSVVTMVEPLGAEIVTWSSTSALVSVEPDNLTDEECAVVAKWRLTHG